MIGSVNFVLKYEVEYNQEILDQIGTNKYGKNDLVKFD
jgi:hypothetical protein